jgi:prophage regulatory protein
MNKNKKNFLRLPMVMNKTGQTRPTIYRGMASGQFPSSYQTSPGVVVWLESEIEEWMEGHIKAARGSEEHVNEDSMRA